MVHAREGKPLLRLFSSEHCDPPESTRLYSDGTQVVGRANLLCEKNVCVCNPIERENAAGLPQ